MNTLEYDFLCEIRKVEDCLRKMRAIHKAMLRKGDAGAPAAKRVKRKKAEQTDLFAAAKAKPVVAKKARKVKAKKVAKKRRLKSPAKRKLGATKKSAWSNGHAAL